MKKDPLIDLTCTEMLVLIQAIADAIDRGQMELVAGAIASITTIALCQLKDANWTAPEVTDVNNIIIGVRARIQTQRQTYEGRAEEISNWLRQEQGSTNEPN